MKRSAIKRYILLQVIIVCVFTLTTSLPSTWAQLTGEVITIDYPRQVEAGADMTVTMEVENTGEGLWDGVCAFIGYRAVEGEEKVTEVHTCNSQGILEPGEASEYICTAKIEPVGRVESVWAGVGAPFG